MISPECDINEFINFVKDEELKENILVSCVLEYRSAERLLHRSNNGERERIRNYIDVLRGLGWLLQTDGRPAGVSDPYFELCRPIIEHLVENDQMKSEVLEIFK